MDTADPVAGAAAGSRPDREELEARVYQHQVVSLLGQRALAGADLTTLLHETASQVAQAMGVEHVQILELQPDSGSLLLRAGMGWGKGLVGAATVESGPNSLGGYTLLSGEPVIVEDLQQETRFRVPPLLREHGIISCASVIIGGRHRPFGVLGAGATGARQFTRDDVHFLQAVANVVAAAVERKRSDEWMAGEQRVLEMVAGGAPLPDVLSGLALILERQSGEMLCSVQLLDDGGRCFRCGAAPSRPETCLRALDGLAAGDPAGPGGAAANLTRPAVAADTAADPRWRDHRDLARQHGLTARWFAPVVSRNGEVLGAFSLYYRSPRIPNPEERRLIERAVQIAGIAIEHARDHEALQQSEARFRAIFENAAIGISLQDLQGRAVEINPALEKMMGYRSEEFRAMAFNTITHPDDAKLESQLFEELAGGQRDAYQMEKRGIRKDGCLVWCRVNRTVIRGASGEPRFALGMVEDITERKQAEGALRQQKEILQKIFDHIPVMVSFLDAAGKIQMVNREWERVLGWSLEEAQSRNILSEAYPAPAGLSSMAESVRPAAGEWRDFRPRTRDGGVLDTLWAHVRLSDGAGIGIGQDITERKRLEAELHEARRMEAIGRLAGGVAHEFNNLLTVIAGYGQILRERLPAGDRLRENVDEILAAAWRATLFTRRLLIFGRRQVARTQAVELNRLVRETERMLRPLIGEGITLAMNLDPAAGRVKMDPAQLQEVIVSLVTNACEAMPEGGTLTIETATEAAKPALEEPDARLDPVGGPAAPGSAGRGPGAYGVLTIHDTGCGMDAATQARLFEPFFTTKGSAQATGLGLSIVYGIVQQSGGSIRVLSEPGRGSTFRVCLPLAEPGDEPAPSRPAEAGKDARTVLLVEDEAAVRGLVSEALRKGGYQVLEARRGEEALEISRRHDGPIDLLATDILMPGMSGRDLANRLAAERPEMKVLYMSGYAGDAITEHNPAGPTAFLQKPFTIERLHEVVREVLARPKAARRAAAPE